MQQKCAQSHCGGNDLDPPHTQTRKGQLAKRSAGQHSSMTCLVYLLGEAGAHLEWFPGQHHWAGTCYDQQKAA